MRRPLLGGCFLYEGRGNPKKRLERRDRAKKKRQKPRFKRLSSWLPPRHSCPVSIHETTHTHRDTTHTHTPPRGWRARVLCVQREVGGFREKVIMILKEVYSRAYPESATCVQRFDDSLNSAIRITYRISLRSSSSREPRYPLLRIVSFSLFCSRNFVPIFRFLVVTFFCCVIGRKKENEISDTPPPPPPSRSLAHLSAEREKRRGGKGEKEIAPKMTGNKGV